MGIVLPQSSWLGSIQKCDVKHGLLLVSLWFLSDCQGGRVDGTGASVVWPNEHPPDVVMIIGYFAFWWTLIFTFIHFPILKLSTCYFRCIDLLQGTVALWSTRELNQQSHSVLRLPKKIPIDPD